MSFKMTIAVRIGRGSESSLLTSRWFSCRVAELETSRKESVISESVPVLSIGSGGGRDVSLKQGDGVPDESVERGLKLFIADFGSKAM